MKKIYKKLTQDQISRGVIFSSTLSYNRRDDELGQQTHEVKNEPGASKTIERLLNDSFFDRSPWKFNIIRK